jgi:hypothetical protein
MDFTIAAFIWSVCVCAVVGREGFLFFLVRHELKAAPRSNWAIGISV